MKLGDGAGGRVKLLDKGSRYCVPLDSIKKGAGAAAYRFCFHVATLEKRAY